MMPRSLGMLLVPVCVSAAPERAISREVIRQTAAGHPMQYDLSLPKGWKPGKRWPVVLVIESADRRFAENAKAFDKARGDLPFIIVAPLVLTNGGPAVRVKDVYPYSAEVWSEVERSGPWEFDRKGVAAVLADVRTRFGGEKRVYVTGWEAGAHTLWALLFHDSSRYLAGAPVTPNFAGRWLEGAPPRAAAPVPVRCFVGSDDSLWKNFSSQWDRARTEARERGFRDLSVTTVPNAGHGPLAAAVLRYFWSLRSPAPR